MADRPKVNSSGQRELDKSIAQIDGFNDEIKELTLDRMNLAPKLEVEQQTRLSDREAQKSADVYIKPERTVGSPDKFNEKFRDDYNFAKEFVKIIAENKEIIGETLEFWTKPFPGVPAQFWRVPVNRPIWVHRYVAERIKGCSYHRLSMNESVQTETNSMGAMYGKIVVDNTVQRLDAIPVGNRKSIFMGASGF
jgi:hypothetical protein